LVGVEVRWDATRRRFEELAGTEREIPCGLVLLALGFTGPEVSTWSGTELAVDGRGNVAASAEQFSSSEANVYACGDARRGQSLVVWAIWEGRECARAVDHALTGEARMTGVPQRWALTG
jgi:glutamate synthase (NADPH) small chain